MVSGGPNLSKMAKVRCPLMLEPEQSRDSGEGTAHVLFLRAAHQSSLVQIQNHLSHREQHQSLVRLPQSASPSAEHLCDSEVQP